MLGREFSFVFVRPDPEAFVRRVWSRQVADRRLSLWRGQKFSGFVILIGLRIAATFEPVGRLILHVREHPNLRPSGIRISVRANGATQTKLCYPPPGEGDSSLTA